jgi:hypothetical protein
MTVLLLSLWYFHGRFSRYPILAVKVEGLYTAPSTEEMNVMEMARCGGLLLALATISLVGPVWADEWPAPRPIVAFSESGTFFVRILPGKSFGDTYGFAKAAKGPYAHAEFYARQRDKTYKLAWEKDLLNPVSPFLVLMNDGGYIMTFDNWHNLGFGSVVAIYGPGGTVVRNYTLDQLYSTEQVESIPRSVSSRYWRCGSPVFTDPKEQAAVVVQEALGGQFVFDLKTGGVQYAPGKAACEQE